MDVNVICENAKHFILFRMRGENTPIKTNIDLDKPNIDTEINKIGYVTLVSRDLSVCVFKFGSKKINAANNKAILSNPNFNNNKDVVFVVHEAKEIKSLMGSYVKNKSALNYNIKVVYGYYFMTNLPKHIMFVEYQLISDSADEAAIKGYIRDVNLLPKISEMDVCIFWYGFKPNTIVTERIPSETCGVSITYKLII